MDAVMDSLREWGDWLLESLTSCCGPGHTDERAEDGERARLLGEADIRSGEARSRG